MIMLIIQFYCQMALELVGHIREDWLGTFDAFNNTIYLPVFEMFV